MSWCWVQYAYYLLLLMMWRFRLIGWELDTKAKQEFLDGKSLKDTRVGG